MKPASAQVLTQDSIVRVAESGCWVERMRPNSPSTQHPWEVQPGGSVAGGAVGVGVGTSMVPSR